MVLRNTIDFFENNVAYFAKHPFEFQRLIAQLETMEMQQEFEKYVFNYYYADVLLYLQVQVPKVVPEAKDVATQFLEASQQQPVSTHVHVNELRIAQAFKALSPLYKEGKNEQKLVRDTLLQCNSKEVLILEELILE